MTKKPCHLGRTYDPNCVGCEAVNDEKSINYMHIARTVGCAHCNSQLASLPDGIKCVCICHDEKPKCCDECYSTYTEKTYPMHTVYDACINQVCKCHDEKQTNSEISLHSGKDTNYLSAPQEESNVEHCDEPSCPECDIAAYERGRKDERERLTKEMQFNCGLRVARERAEEREQNFSRAHSQLIHEFLQVMPEYAFDTEYNKISSLLVEIMNHIVYSRSKKNVILTPLKKLLEEARVLERERVVKEALAYMQRCLLWSKGTVEGTRNDLIAKTANHFGITLSEAEEGKES